MNFAATEIDLLRTIKSNFTSKLGSTEFHADADSGSIKAAVMKRGSSETMHEGIQNTNTKCKNNNFTQPIVLTRTELHLTEK